MDREATQELFNQFTYWSWERRLELSEDEMNQFFIEKGTTREKFIESVLLYKLLPTVTLVDLQKCERNGSPINNEHSRK